MNISRCLSGLSTFEWLRYWNRGGGGGGEVSNVVDATPARPKREIRGAVIGLQPFKVLLGMASHLARGSGHDTKP